MQKMHPIHRGATSLKERRHMQGGIHRSEMLLPGLRQHLGFMHTVTAQGGITAAHQQQIMLLKAFSRHGQHQSIHNLAVAGRRGLRRERPRVRQHKQQRRGVPQPPTQRCLIPSQQQRATVHRLRTGGIVVDNDNLHGTIGWCTDLACSLTCLNKGCLP